MVLSESQPLEPGTRLNPVLAKLIVTSLDMRLHPRSLRDEATHKGLGGWDDRCRSGQRIIIQLREDRPIPLKPGGLQLEFSWQVFIPSQLGQNVRLNSRAKTTPEICLLTQK